jgi:phage-related protein
MSSIGKGVKEIRVRDDSGIYRVIYMHFKEIIYVLHAFQKKTEVTSKLDIELTKKHYSELVRRL